MVLEGSSVIFPNLGIEIANLTSSFNIFGIKIAWYGVIIACGMILAVVISMLLAKKTNQDIDDYIDIAICAIIGGLIGARAYYVIFSWDEYKDNLIQIFNIRAGGLAIYGGLIGGIITAFVVCRIKKISFLRVFDTAAPAIAFAQAIGRWGNFFNMEAYGGYTDNLFAMQLNYDQASGVVTDELLEKIVEIDGVEYIQVHPTFLYECMWCLVVGILILIFRRFQKYSGEVLLWYIGGYALGRSWIEGLRTDQLLIGNSGIAISQLLSIALVAGALCLLIINRIRLATKQWVPEFTLVLESGAPGTVEFTQAKTQARKERREAKKGKAKEAADNSEAAQAQEEAVQAQEEAAQAQEKTADAGIWEENEISAQEAALPDAQAEDSASEVAAAGFDEAEAAESETVQTENVETENVETENPQVPEAETVQTDGTETGTPQAEDLKTEPADNREAEAETAESESAQIQTPQAEDAKTEPAGVREDEAETAESESSGTES